MTHQQDPSLDNRRFHAADKDKLHSKERTRFQPAVAVADLAESLHPNSILDIGVGTGYFALALLKRLPRAKLTGLDVSQEMLQTFEARAADAELQDRITSVLHDLDQPKAWPLDPESFDLTLAMSLVHELTDRDAFAREVARVLRPNGTLLVVDWDPTASGPHGPPLSHRVPADLVIPTLDRHHLILEDRPPLYRDFYSLVFKKT